MPSTDPEADRVSRLIERLLVDPGFRAEFRRDPVGVCVAAGLPGLAGELDGGGAGLETLELRESRSSLAGVVMAAAVEGLSLVEAQSLLAGGAAGHGLHGVRVPRALRGVPGVAAAERSLGHAERPVSHVERAAHATPPAAAAPSTPPPGAGAAPSTPPPPGAGAPAADAATAPALAPAAHAPSALAPAAHATSAPAAPPAPAPPSNLPWPDQPAPPAGPGAVAAVVSPAPAGGGGVAALLASSGLSAPPAVRAWLGSAGVDPRLVSVLESVVAHHTVTLANVVSDVSPVHVQAVDIVAVDGQPVGPDNFAARDLVTEIAALGAGVRPDEIGTPWPIQSPGFFSDGGSQGALHLAFEAPGTNSGQAAELAGSGTPAPATPVQPAAGAAPAAGAVPAVQAAPAVPGVQPAPAVPGVQAAPAVPAAAVTPAAGAGPGGGIVESAAASATPSGPPSDPFYASPKAHAAFEAAKGELGVHYQWGGTSPSTGFDCSGLMQWAYHQAGVDLPRVAADQFNVGTPVSLNDLREGDLVFFRIGGGEVDHVGMYVGNHQFLEAPRTGENVQYADLRTPYWAQQFAGARRIVPMAGSGAPASAPGAFAPPAGPASAPATPTPAPPAGPASAPATPAPAAGAPAAPATVPQPPAPPGTASFKGLEQHATPAQRNTVKFLQAIQPPQAPTAAPAEVQAQAAAQTGAAPPAQDAVQQVAQAQPGQPAAPGVAAQVASLPPAPAGSIVSVSSPLLTSGQQIFAARLAQLTGLDPHVVAAWELAEESGGAAQARQAASNFNWLNIGYFDSGAGQIAFDHAFSDPASAAEQTARFLKGSWGGASEGIRAILNTVGQPPDQQMMAIANSGWASSHYGGGANLRATFDELGDLKVERAPVAPAAPAPAPAVAPSQA